MEIENSSVADSQPVVASENTQTSTPSPASDTRTKFEDKLAAVRGIKTEKKEAPASATAPSQDSPAPETKQPGETQGRKEGQEKPFKRERDNRRFDELTKRLHEREATIAELRKQVQSVQAPKTRSEYSSDEEYIKDLAKHSATDEYLNSQITALEQRQAHEQKAAWDEQVKAQSANPEAFHKELASVVRSGMIDQSTEEYVMSSPVGVKMLEVFMQKLKQPGFKEMWDKMPAMKKGVHLYDLEQRVQVDNSRKPAQQNQAPAPSLAPAKGDRAPVPGTVQSAFDQKLSRVRQGWRR